jgi:ABC-type transport system substrate-binding protein
MVLSRLSRVILALPSLLLLLALACGAATEPTQAPAPETGATSAPTQAPANGDASAPTAMPQATTAPPAAEEGPAGTLNVGHPDIGPFTYHPTTVGNPQIYVVSTTLGEGLVHFDKDKEVKPMLAESWSISEDFTTWTFNIRRGVQFHHGYGEMTAEDIVYSYRDGWANSTIHARGSFITDFWQHPEGSVETPDDYTVVVDTGVPWVDVRAHEFHRHVGGTSANVVSKAQSEELGVEEAARDIAMTGSWELVEASTGELWRMTAVEDHWRKTPHFAELVLWEIPEESARLAGFQTGNLDTFTMSFDNIPRVEEVEGARIQKGGIIGQAGLNLYGQMYDGVGTPEQHEAFDPDRAWVSANPDVNSVEWDNARKVRQALSIAIDRQSIVDTLLGGFGGVLPVRDWAGFESRMPEHWRWEFDPERARELIAEAGYPDGFTIDLVPAIRGAPSEVEACEAIATMWGNVGVDVRLQRIPYETLRPQLVARTWGGATCHTVSERLEPVLGLSNYIDASVFSYGTFHPWMEDHAPAVMAELDSAKRFQGTLEFYDWFTMQQTLGFGLYFVQGAIPVGPRIEEWEYTSYSDIRLPNGYENTRPRQ